ncbi:hypothetical protein ACJX0J_009091 [Zea mays]
MCSVVCSFYLGDVFYVMFLCFPIEGMLFLTSIIFMPFKLVIFTTTCSLNYFLNNKFSVGPSGEHFSKKNRMQHKLRAGEEKYWPQKENESILEIFLAITKCKRHKQINNPNQNLFASKCTLWHIMTNTMILSQVLSMNKQMARLTILVFISLNLLSGNREMTNDTKMIFDFNAVGGTDTNKIIIDAL